MEKLFCTVFNFKLARLLHKQCIGFRTRTTKVKVENVNKIGFAIQRSSYHRRLQKQTRTIVMNELFLLLKKLPLFR
jgi:hypothetical protein